MIELKGLCKSFEEKEVPKDINTTFEKWKKKPNHRAERFGKNHTANVSGLLTPDKGELLYDHRNFLAMGKKERKRSAGKWE